MSLPWAKFDPATVCQGIMTHRWTKESPCPEYVAKLELSALLAAGLLQGWSIRSLALRWYCSRDVVRRLVVEWHGDLISLGWDDEIKLDRYKTTAIAKRFRTLRALNPQTSTADPQGSTPDPQEPTDARAILTEAEAEAELDQGNGGDAPFPPRGADAPSTPGAVEQPGGEVPAGSSPDPAPAPPLAQAPLPGLGGGAPTQDGREADGDDDGDGAGVDPSRGGGEAGDDYGPGDDGDAIRGSGRTGAAPKRPGRHGPQQAPGTGDGRTQHGASRGGGPTQGVRAGGERDREAGGGERRGGRGPGDPRGAGEDGRARDDRRERGEDDQQAADRRSRPRGPAGRDRVIARLDAPGALQALGLTRVGRDSLLDEGLVHPKDFATWTEKRLASLHQVGPKAVRSLKAWLAAHDLELKAVAPRRSSFDRARARLVGDAWVAQWKPRRDGRSYIWLDWPRKDGPACARIAESARVPVGAAQDDPAVARLHQAMGAYLDAADAGDVWPVEPPTLGRFATQIPKWMQVADGYTARRRTPPHMRLVGDYPQEILDEECG